LAKPNYGFRVAKAGLEGKEGDKHYVQLRERALLTNNRNPGVLTDNKLKSCYAYQAQRQKGLGVPVRQVKGVHDPNV